MIADIKKIQINDFEYISNIDVYNMNILQCYNGYHSK